MVKKSHRTKVGVRSRQVLQPQQSRVQWPTEPSHELPPTLAEVDDDNNNEQPVGLPLGLANRMNEPDDQPVLHIYDLTEPQDQDGCLDPDDDGGEYLDMSDWESD